MAEIISYPTATPKSGDYVLGAQISPPGSKENNPTKKFTIQSLQSGLFPNLAAHADNAAALAAGLVPGQTYQTDGTGAPPLNVAGIVMIVQ